MSTLEQLLRDSIALNERRHPTLKLNTEGTKTMQTYWDLSEKERAQLSSAEVEKFADAELMLKGVLKVPPLKLTEVPEMPEPDLKLVFIKHDFREADLAYTTDEDADLACASAYHISSEYVNGQSVEVAYDLKDDRAFTTKKVYSERKFKTLRATIEKVTAAKSANARAEKENSEALKKQQDALQGMWSDWHDCIAKHESLGQVINTFRDYEKTAGDQEVAAKFLRKVFPMERILEAAEWFGIAIPGTESEAAE